MDEAWQPATLMGPLGGKGNRDDTGELRALGGGAGPGRSRNGSSFVTGGKADEVDKNADRAMIRGGKNGTMPSEGFWIDPLRSSLPKTKKEYISSFCFLATYT